MVSSNMEILRDIRYELVVLIFKKTKVKIPDCFLTYIFSYMEIYHFRNMQI